MKRKSNRLRLGTGKALVALRISSPRQQRSGSLRLQNDALRRYAAEHGGSIVKLVTTTKATAK